MVSGGSAVKLWTEINRTRRKKLSVFVVLYILVSNLNEILFKLKMVEEKTAF